MNEAEYPKDIYNWSIQPGCKVAIAVVSGRSSASLLVVQVKRIDRTRSGNLWMIYEGKTWGGKPAEKRTNRFQAMLVVEAV